MSDEDDRSGPHELDPRPAPFSVPPARPSFFPDENPEQSRGFADQLVPSLRPPPGGGGGSGLIDAPGPVADGGGDEISSVVLLHTHERTPAAPSSRPPPRRSLRPGLLSSWLGEEAVPSDEGALAALRTLPRRKPRTLATPLLGEGPEVERERARLLSHLADHSKGAERARLCVAAGELHTRLGDLDRAAVAHATAHRADPRDPVALRRHRRDLRRGGDLAAVAEALRAESQLPLTAQERALVLCELAQVLHASGRDPREVEACVDEAERADPGSPLPALLHAEVWRALEDAERAAQALQRAAEAWGDDAGRAALDLQAGRMFERAGLPERALSVYARASAADPLSFGAALGAYRACRATSQIEGAQQALAALADTTQDERLRGELHRHRARLLHARLGDPARALAVLSPLGSREAARDRAQAAAALGDQAAYTQALLAWAGAAFGREQGFALLELAEQLARTGLHERAREALREAGRAGAPQPLLATTAEQLARARGDAGGVAQAEEDSGHALGAAARLAMEPAQLARELQLLRDAAEQSADPTAEVLALDAAFEAADLASITALALRDAARSEPRDRVGAWLTLLDVVETRDPAMHGELTALLREHAGSSLLALRRLASDTGDPRELAALWRAQADHTEGQLAAFAATMAGRYLEAAAADGIEALAEALDACPGYAPACHALELAARRRGDLLALERAHRELAAVTACPTERAARHVRLALLSADGDPQGALRWLDRAADDRRADVLLATLAARLCEQRPIDERVARAVASAGAGDAPAFERAARRSAAALCEHGGRREEAAALYEAVLAGAPGDAFAAAGATACRDAFEPLPELQARAERDLLRCEDPRRRPGWLSKLAGLQERLGHADRARAILETLLDNDPERLAELRALQRIAWASGDRALGALASARLAERLSDPRDRVAELRLSLRLLPADRLDQADALLAAAEARAPDDVWYATALEASALRTGDRARYYDAMSLLSRLLGEPAERACYAVRAAEAFEVAAPARAAADLESCLLCAPSHPLAVEALARLQRAAGNARGAAELFARAAEGRSDKHALQLLHDASVILQDEVGDAASAIAVLTRAARLDVTYADVFPRLRRLLAAAGDRAPLLALVELRLCRPADASLQSELQSDRARLYLEAGERTQARMALEAALALDPARVDALRTLARLCSDAHDHHGAADALVRLARLAADRDTLAFAFAELGELYEGPLPDPRRAEIAWTRVIGLTPEDPRPVERLARLFARQGKHERAVRAWDHLRGSSKAEQEHARYTVELARSLEHAGDPRGAEQVLEAARAAASGSAPLLRELRELYTRTGDKPALSVHLTRSCHGLRKAIEDAPEQLESWLALLEMLEARERSDALPAVAHAALAVGLRDPRLLAYGEAVAGLGRAGLSSRVATKLAPKGSSEATRALLEAAARELAAITTPAALTETRAVVDAPRAIAAAAELFEVGEYILRETDAPLCVVTSEQPTTLVIGKPLLAQASEAELFFLCARALQVARAGFALVVAADPEQLLLALHALHRVFAPAHAVAAVDAERLASLAAQLAQQLDAPRRAQLTLLVTSALAEGDWNPRRLAAQALEQAGRVALCVTGNLRAALDALLRLRAEAAPGADGTERAAALRSDPQARALLSFAISEAYLDLRRGLGGRG